MNEEVYILHLETSTKVCSAALSKNGELLDCIESNDEEFSHGEKLTLFVEDLLKKNNLPFNKLSAVSVASGPGSYTGLRIGTSTAKGFCYALKIPLLSVDSLSSLYQQALTKHKGKNICAMIDARRMEVFSAIFNSKGEMIKKLSADILDETTYEEYLPMVCIGDAVAKMQAVWENRDIEFETEITSSSIGQIKLTYQKFLTNEFEDVAYFEPFYLKDFMIIQPKAKQ